MTEEERDKFVADEIKAGRCPFGNLEPGQWIAKCPLGFPGCGCGDELMLNPFLQNMQIKVKKLHKDAQLPLFVHGNTEDAGADLRSIEAVTLMPGEILAIRTGLAFEIPPSYMGEVRSRSGMAQRGVVVNNSPGTVDPGYRGEMLVILHHQLRAGEQRPFHVNVGDRIAQLVIVPYIAADYVVEETLADSLRGEGGRGSTGVA